MRRNVSEDAMQEEDHKYSVPALDRAHRILACITENPAKLRLTDIVRATGLHKGTVFATLAAMRKLGWVQCTSQKTFEIGQTLTFYGSARLFQFELIKLFHDEARHCSEVLDTTYQLAILDKTDVLYLAKVESSGALKTPTYPGLRLPAHSTALGKVLLSDCTREALDALFPEKKLPQITPATVSTVEGLYEQLSVYRQKGFCQEVEEAMYGYACVAAPIRNVIGSVAAAVSITGVASQSRAAFDTAASTVCMLAGNISRKLNGLADESAPCLPKDAAC